MSELIVVIDDDKEDLDLIREMLEVKQVVGEVQTFTDSQKPLAFIKDKIHKLQCILCDINMPKLNGFELRKQVLETCPATKEIPFVFISTSHSTEDQQRAAQLKATALLQKPSSLQGIETLTERIIELTGLERVSTNP